MRWFRPLEVLILVSGVTVGFFMGKIDPLAYFGFATGLVVFWFKSRDESKKGDANAKRE